MAIFQKSLCKWKKCSGETQTLRAGCSKVEPKIFAPPQTTFPEAWDGQNLISWRWSLPLPTNPVWWGSVLAVSSYHGNRPIHTNTQTGPITIHCTAASTQCNQYQNVGPSWIYCRRDDEGGSSDKWQLEFFKMCNCKAVQGVPIKSNPYNLLLITYQLFKLSLCCLKGGGGLQELSISHE